MCLVEGFQEDQRICLLGPESMVAEDMADNIMMTTGDSPYDFVCVVGYIYTRGDRLLSYTATTVPTRLDL